MPLLGKAEKGQLEELILQKFQAHYDQNGPGSLLADGARVVVHGTGVDIDHGEHPDPYAAVRLKTLFTAFANSRRARGDAARRARVPRHRGHQRRCRAHQPHRPGMSRAATNREVVGRSLAAVWHPCTQMKAHERFPLVPVARGEGAWLVDFDGRRYLDGVSSWWVNLFGH